jgi:prepilin-type N-terminal cleavage/methylation domain-containing protein
MRQRGVTLIELMIAMSLAAVMSAFMLMLTRGQLVAYEMSDQITRAQQNARSGIDFLESTLRRACSGAPTGRLIMMAATATKHEGDILPCLVFTNSLTAADSLEVYYGGPPCDVNGNCSSKLIQTTGTLDLFTNPISTIPITGDATLFEDRDYVMVSSYYDAFVYQVNGKPTSATSLSVVTPGSTPQNESVPTSGYQPVQKIYNRVGGPTGDPSNYNGPFMVMKLYGFRFTLDTGATSNTKGMLLVDGGELGSHSQFGGVLPMSQPIVDGVEDFQVAIGNDQDVNGTILEQPASPSTDEVIGNNPGTPELLTPPSATSPWGVWNGTAEPIVPRTIRVSLLIRTNNLYPGNPNVPSAIEDRTSWSVAPTDPSGPRLRLLRTVVAPRAFNPNI